MKAFFITIVIFVSAFLLYDRFLTPPGLRVIFENPPLEVDDGPPSRTRPSMTESRVDPTSAAPDAVFVPPQIEPLESLTKNWTVFPPTAFPRQVKLNKPVQLQMNGGSSTLPAGATAYAFAAQANVLLVAPAEGSAARGQIFVHDTDLPTQVRASYERWKKGRIEMALAAWKKRQSSSNAGGTNLPGAVDVTGRPKRNADGSYDLLLASMKSGQVTDIKLNKIQRWGTPQATTIDNKPGWAVSVFYETMAFCGPIDAEAQAHVCEGRVLRWIYPGSGEPVP